MNLIVVVKLIVLVQVCGDEGDVAGVQLSEHFLHLRFLMLPLVFIATRGWVRLRQLLILNRQVLVALLVVEY
jgi:hypothetical protein